MQGTVLVANRVRQTQIIIHTYRNPQHGGTLLLVNHTNLLFHSLQLFITSPTLELDDDDDNGDDGDDECSLRVSVELQEAAVKTTPIHDASWTRFF